MAEEKFGEYKEALSGLTHENLPEVTRKLMEIGLGGAVTTIPDDDTTMKESGDMKRLREVAVSLLGGERGETLATLVG